MVWRSEAVGKMAFTQRRLEAVGTRDGGSCNQLVEPDRCGVQLHTAYYSLKLWGWSYGGFHAVTGTEAVETEGGSLYLLTTLLSTRGLPLVWKLRRTR